MQRRDLLLDQVQPLQERTQDLAMQSAQGCRGAKRIRQLFRVAFSSGCARAASAAASVSPSANLAGVAAAPHL
jgi:hypothetical protein